MRVRSRRCLSPLIMKLSSSLRFAFGQMVTSCFHIIQAASSKFIRLMYVCMLVCLSLFLSACLSMYDMYVCTYAGMYVCVWMHAFEHVCINVCMDESVCVCVWMYACRHVCMYDMYKGDICRCVSVRECTQVLHTSLSSLHLYTSCIEYHMCLCVCVSFHMTQAFTSWGHCDKYSSGPRPWPHMDVGCICIWVFWEINECSRKTRSDGTHFLINVTCFSIIHAKAKHIF